MSETVIIKSSNNDYELRLSQPKPLGLHHDVEYIQVSINGHDLTASSSEVYLYDSAHLAEFFADLAASWKGWEGEKSWGSIEEDFCIIATSDGLGHIQLRTKLRSGPYAGDWSVEVVIEVEAGQTDEIARKVKRLLHVQ